MRRYSIAHPDLCWVCFDLRLRCHHTRTRWSELVRRVELWLEVHELDEEGKYVPVTIHQQTEVTSLHSSLNLVHLDIVKILLILTSRKSCSY